MTTKKRLILHKKIHINKGKLFDLKLTKQDNLEILEEKKSGLLVSCGVFDVFLDYELLNQYSHEIKD